MSFRWASSRAHGPSVESAEANGLPEAHGPSHGPPKVYGPRGHCTPSLSAPLCINSWGSASETTLHPLKIILKRNMRIITGSKCRAHAEPLFYQLQCLKLNDIYKLEMAKLMYRINNNMIS